jgi:hypothetical protein
VRLGFTSSFRQSEAGYGLYLEPAEQNEESLILLWDLESARCSTLRLRKGFDGTCPRPGAAPRAAPFAKGPDFLNAQPVAGLCLRADDSELRGATDETDYFRIATMRKVGRTRQYKRVCRY